MARTPAHMVGGTMLVSTAAELRENSRRAREMATEETDPYFKRMGASHALALEQLAEKIERGEVAVQMSLANMMVRSDDPALQN